MKEYVRKLYTAIELTDVLGELSIICRMYKVDGEESLENYIVKHLSKNGYRIVKVTQ